MTRGAVACLIGLLLSAGPPPAHQVGADDVSIRRVLDAGAYAEAERQAAEWCARVESERGPESNDLPRALDLLVEALVRNGRSAEPRTLTVAERSLRLRERESGRHPFEVAASLNELAAVRAQRGEYRSALALYERASVLRPEAGDRGSSSLADSLEGVARALADLARFDRAQVPLDESLAIREARSTESPLAYARTLELAGHLRRESGRYQHAAEALDDALSLWNRHAPEHPDKTMALVLRADASDAAGHDLAALGQELLQQVDVLEIQPRRERRIGLEGALLAARVAPTLGPGGAGRRIRPRAGLDDDAHELPAKGLCAVLRPERPPASDL